MIRQISLASYLAVTLTALTACSSSTSGGTATDGGAGGGATGTYAAKCNLACAPVKSCSTQDPSKCEADCSTATEGLTAACAQCITENSHWNGTYCANGSKCSIGSDCFGACTPADESCLGYSIAKASESPCATVCK